MRVVCVFLCLYVCVFVCMCVQSVQSVREVRERVPTRRELRIANQRLMSVRVASFEIFVCVSEEVQVLSAATRGVGVVDARFACCLCIAIFFIRAARR